MTARFRQTLADSIGFLIPLIMAGLVASSVLWDCARAEQPALRDLLLSVIDDKGVHHVRKWPGFEIELEVSQDFFSGRPIRGDDITGDMHALALEALRTELRRIEMQTPYRFKLKRGAIPPPHLSLLYATRSRAKDEPSAEVEILQARQSRRAQHLAVALPAGMAQLSSIDGSIYAAQCSFAFDLHDFLVYEAYSMINTWKQAQLDRDWLLRNRYQSFNGPAERSCTHGVPDNVLLEMGVGYGVNFSACGATWNITRMASCSRDYYKQRLRGVLRECLQTMLGVSQSPLVSDGRLQAVRSGMCRSPEAAIADAERSVFMSHLSKEEQKILLQGAGENFEEAYYSSLPEAMRRWTVLGLASPACRQASPEQSLRALQIVAGPEVRPGSVLSIHELDLVPNSKDIQVPPREAVARPWPCRLR